MTLELTCAQQQAVESDSHLILCCSGPGGGKTRVLTERIKRLVADGHDPSGMVAISYTNAAADTLKDRLAGTLQYCGTLHGYMLRLIQRHGSLIGFGQSVGVLSEEQADRLLEQTVQDMRAKCTKAMLADEIAKGPQAITPNPSNAAMVAASFFRKLKQSGLVTFDTLLSYGLKLAGHVDQETAHFLFVDEYQDASDLDAAIYTALPFVNKFMVGDGDQAIYSFRGGAVQNFIDLGRHADHVILLEENFRSDRLICAAANRLISHNDDRIPKEIVPVSDANGIATSVRHRNASAELSWLVDLITHQDGPSCAVLARTNALVDSVTQHLTGLGIAVARRQKPERPHDWETARALLLVLNDPENDLLAGWLLEKREGEPRAAVMKLEAMAKGMSINAYTWKLPRVTPIDEVPSVMARAGLSRESVQYVEDRLQSCNCSTIAELLLALAADDQKAEQVGEGCTVCTIFAAKGREWDTVVCVGFEEGCIPSAQAIKAGEEAIAEERRVAFVGLTRARHALYVSYCDTRVPEWGPKIGQPRQPSRFLQESGLL